MKNSLLALYQTVVFKYSKITLLVVALLLAFMSQFATNFRLDASSDSLVLENDQSLKYYREVVSKYNTGDYLVLTYSPLQTTGDLFSDAVLADLTTLRDNILNLGNIKSVISILDVPLTQSPKLTLAELNGKPQLLLSDKTNRELAKAELRDSQLYRDLLVSNDFSTTAIIISLNSDQEVSQLLDRRDALTQLKATSSGTSDFSEQQEQELNTVRLEYQQKLDAFQLRQSQLISDVRGLLAQHQDKATMFLGGLPMIVTDSISFIQGDIVVFGSAALLVIILILAIAFRQIGWVVMPLITCFSSGYLMVCLLGLLNWPISVVSSNFLSLLLIITLSLNIHLIVRYRELSKLHPSKSQFDLVSETVMSKFIPCLYTSLTTIVAFASLIVSGIRPVIDFGYIMCLGIVVSLLTTFVLFPALALLLKPKAVTANRDAASKVILKATKNAYTQSRFASMGFTLVVLIACFGLANLTVENRFIDYFKPNTEIYQGMLQIDEKLGGTTPLDIILDAPASFNEQQAKLTAANAEQANLAQETDSYDEDFDDFDIDTDSASGANLTNNSDSFDDDFNDFDDFDIPSEGDSQTDDTSSSISSGNLAFSSYWFNEAGLQKLREIHESLERLPATGKILSLATSMSIFDNLKDAKPMDNIDLGFMYNVLSDNNKNTLFTPYMSADGNQAHISIRVFESQKGLDRNQLIKDIRTLLINEHGLEDEQINISGMLVLYNNMLNSLFSSQIMTLGTVFLVILLMFIVLFRSFKVAAITLIPNIFSASVVLGLMGLFAIPLDLMTITIAAISVGIAVDNSIHYVARLKDELSTGNSYRDAIEAATNNIGQAMFYTTIVITAGFLIMVFSNFVPTMYFGVLTATAMVTALIANLVMLPILLERFKPFKA